MNFDSRDYLEKVNVSRGGNAAVEYAGFWIRLVAYIVDAIIIAVPVTIVLGVFMAILIFASADKSRGSAEFAGTSCFMCLIYPAYFIALWLYFAGFESSKYMATPGKMLIGVKVTDLDGNQITFGKATLRFISKTIINSVFGIGSLYIAISDKKQGLYDVIASTFVVKK